MKAGDVLFCVRRLVISALLFGITIVLGHFSRPECRADSPKSQAQDAGNRQTGNRLPRTRKFHFTYELKVIGQKPDSKIRVWIPVPPSNEDQSAEMISRELPGQMQIADEPKYGNRILFFEGSADQQGAMAARVTYVVVRNEVRADTKSPAESSEEVGRFLQPDSRVPISGRAISLLENRVLPGDQMQLARTLYDLVNDHMTYSKQGIGWGNGDSVWACDSKYGNCSDFHSLFISLARSRQIPAKFEMGFPLPPEKGQGEIAGYHCWAKFRPRGRGWVPVDISEANKVKAKDPEQVAYYFGNLTEDRVTFTIGRDITLVPPQAGPPLNFFVYPYAEVNGASVPSEQLTRRFSFADQN